MAAGPWTDSDQQVADAISSYWVNFATGGEAGGEGGSNKWPVF